MKKVLLMLSLFPLAACTTLEPVTVTDVEGEYIVVGRDTTPIVSLQSRAEENARNGAIEFCNTLGKQYCKRYSTASPMGAGKWADTTLYFRCIDKNSICGALSNDTVKNSNISPKGNLNSEFEDKLFIRLANLQKLLDAGTITKEEFEREKTIILNQK